MSVKMVSGYSMPNEMSGSSAYGDYRPGTGPARGVRPYWAGQNLTSAQFNDFQAFAGCNCGGQRLSEAPVDASDGLKGAAVFGLGLALLSVFGGKKKR